MEIERYGFGAPRPHSSWREYVRVKTQHQRKWIKTINEQIDDNNGNKLNSVLEDKWKDLIEFFFITRLIILEMNRKM